MNNKYMQLENLVYSKKEIQSKVDESKSKLRNFVKTIQLFNDAVLEGEKVLGAGLPKYKAFKDLSDEELEVFSNAGYEVLPCCKADSEGHTFYSIKLKQEDYNDLDNLGNLNFVIDELREYLEWHEIKSLVKDCALYNYSGYDIYRRNFIMALRDILNDKPELRKILKLK